MYQPKHTQQPLTQRTTQHTTQRTTQQNKTGPVAAVGRQGGAAPRQHRPQRPPPLPHPPARLLRHEGQGHPPPQRRRHRQPGRGVVAPSVRGRRPRAAVREPPEPQLVRVPSCCCCLLLVLFGWLVGSLVCRCCCRFRCCCMSTQHTHRSQKQTLPNTPVNTTHPSTQHTRQRNAAA